MLLITGPYQSGKTYELWKMLRAEKPGAAVLVTPSGETSQELKQQICNWFGPGLLPPTIGITEFFERCLASTGDARPELSAARSAHWLEAWCAKGLAQTCWHSLAGYRGTPRELADLCLRLDQALITDGDLREAARMAQDAFLAQQIDAILRTRQFLRQRSDERKVATAGRRLQALSGADPAVVWEKIYIDDVMSLSPAQLAVLEALDKRRSMVMTAVDDARLGAGAMCERLRAAFVHAEERKLTGADSAQGDDMRTIVSFALDERAITVQPDAIVKYHYRDEAHAGRAIAAVMRRRQIAPGDAVLFVRECNARGLALADALIAAEVPVRGFFQLPYAATAEGGLLSALGAWCSRRTWGNFLPLCQRLCAVAHAVDGVAAAREAPLFLPDLVGPWSTESVADALEKMRALERSSVDSWGWEGTKGLLQTATEWLAAWEQALNAEGNWFERFETLMRRIARTDQALHVLSQLSVLAKDHAVARHHLDEILAAEHVRVERGENRADALLMYDAVRGRATTRDVVLIHDLELGRWPYQPKHAGLFGRDARRNLALALGGRDAYDEEGRKSGEIAAFLAVLARARKQIVLGIPCGEREPSPWLPTLSRQLDWDLEKERRHEDADITPGAPFGPGDSQGDAERALWQEVGQPTFAFRIPERSAQELKLKASELNDLLGDPFAWVCGRMRCAAPLADWSRMEIGIQLHQLLAKLGKDAIYSMSALTQAVDDWIGKPADAVERALRRWQVRGISEAMAREADLFDGAPSHEIKPEMTVETVLRTATGAIKLSGRVDRVDAFSDKTVRIVDYKTGATTYNEILDNKTEGQLLAYALGLSQQGHRVIGAHYRSLANGKIAGYRAADAWYVFSKNSKAHAGVDTAEIDARAQLLIAAIDAVAAGQAATTDDGLCGKYGFAPIARLDEAKLDLSADETADDE
jgi:RecB family exonuclease